MRLSWKDIDSALTELENKEGLSDFDSLADEIKKALRSVSSTHRANAVQLREKRLSAAKRDHRTELETIQAKQNAEAYRMSPEGQSEQAQRCQSLKKRIEVKLSSGEEEEAKISIDDLILEFPEDSDIASYESDFQAVAEAKEVESATRKAEALGSVGSLKSTASIVGHPCISVSWTHGGALLADSFRVERFAESLNERTETISADLVVKDANVRLGVPYRYVITPCYRGIPGKNSTTTESPIVCTAPVTGFRVEKAEGVDASGIVKLVWVNPPWDESAKVDVRLVRDGGVSWDVSGRDSFEDDSVRAGESHHYRLDVTVAGTELVPVECDALVKTVPVPPPVEGAYAYIQGTRPRLSIPNWPDGISEIKIYRPDLKPYDLSREEYGKEGFVFHSEAEVIATTLHAVRRFGSNYVLGPVSHVSTRLINDRRRKRRLIAFTSLVLLITATSIGWLNIRDIKREWRAEGIVLLEELRKYSFWLNTEMNVHRDIDESVARLENISVCLNRQECITQSDVDLISETRKPGCGDEATALAQECRMVINELGYLDRKISYLMSEGTNSLCRLRNMAASEEGIDIDTVRDEANHRYLALQGKLTHGPILSCGYKSYTAECRTFADSVAYKRQTNQAWKDFSVNCASLLNWTNALSKVLTLRDEKNQVLHNRYHALRILPVDRSETLRRVERVMAETLQEVALVALAGEMCHESSCQVEKVLETNLDTALKAHSELSNLREVHGDFVDVSLLSNNLTNASTQLTDLQKLRLVIQSDINLRFGDIQKKLNEIWVCSNILSQTNMALHRIGEEAPDEEFVNMYEAVLSQIRDLDMALAVLVTDITSLTNRVGDAQSHAHEIAGKVQSLLNAVKNTLPNWNIEKNKLEKEFNFVARDIRKIRSDILTIRKELMNYRDNGASGVFSALRLQIMRTLGELEEIYADCKCNSTCSTGKEILTQKERMETMMGRVETIVKDVQVFSNDFEQILNDGALRHITYVPYNFNEDSSPIAHKLQQGVRSFDFALDMPTPGKHEVKVRFCLRDMIYSSAEIVSKVVIKCVVSGVKDSDEELTFCDFSRWEQDREVVLSGDFYAGVNDIHLDLSFMAKSNNDETIADVIWQFQQQYSGSDFGCLTIRFFVDGNELKDILWIEPDEIMLSREEKPSRVTGHCILVVILLLISVVCAIFSVWSEAGFCAGFWVSVFAVVGFSIILIYNLLDV